MGTFIVAAGTRLVTMKLSWVFTATLAGLAAASKVTLIRPKCIPMPTTSNPVAWPHVETETILDFAVLAKLKESIDKKNKEIEKKTPKAKILSFDSLKTKFGDKMLEKFKDMSEDDFKKRKTVKVFKK